MGFGRKVGAFLGLVPEDERAGGYGDDYAEGRRGDQYDEFDGGEYAGEYGRDYGRESGRENNSEYVGESYGPSYGDPQPKSSYAGDRYAARVDSSRSDSGRPDSGRPENNRHDSGFAAEPVTQGALAMQPLVAPRREPDTKAGNRPVTIKLTGFGEARVIGEKYRDGQSVIMDMTEMNDSDARRLVDFAAGLAFAMRGSIDKVTTKVFMLLPSDIDVSDISAEQRREFAGAYGR